MGDPITIARLIERCWDNYQKLAPYLIESAQVNDIPLPLIVGCAVAESKINPKDERWGTRTPEAVDAMNGGAWGKLAEIITAAGNDISFGVSQRIVAGHWAGDRSLTVENCLYVRQATFADPRRDIIEMGKRLRTNLSIMERLQREGSPGTLANVGGDLSLGACVIYNAGHWPEMTETYWRTRQQNIQNYRDGLESAPSLIDGYQSPTPELPEDEGEEWTEGAMTIEDKAKAMTDDGDRLGNGGQPYSPKQTVETDNGPLAFQAFWYGYMWEFTVPVSDSTPDGRDTICEPYPTLTPEEFAHFRGVSA